MKNKYGLIGLVSLLGFWGLYREEPLFLSFFAFALFFEYFFVEPDELFVENMRKAASWAFFANLAVAVSATLALSVTAGSGNALAGGCALGFSAGILVFCCASSYLEWKEKWGSRHAD